MSHECCSFCEQLPGIAQPGWAGRASRCPVCKQELWTAQNGASYRVDAASAPLPRGQGGWFAGGVIALGLFAAACIFWARSGDAVPAPLSAPVVLAALAPTAAPPRNVDVEAAPVPPPEVCAKPIRSEAQARAKPMSDEFLRAARTKASVKVVPALFDDQGPQAKSSKRSIPVSWRWDYVNDASSLAAILANVPEVDLDSGYVKKTKKQIADYAAQIVKENKDQPDAFVRTLMKDRTDLAGMPFLLGNDCRISAAAAKELATHSLGIRAALAKSVPRVSETSRMTGAPRPSAEPDASVFWNLMLDPSRKAQTGKPNLIPALRQIVQVENQDFRTKYVKYLGGISDVIATEALANRAVFDLDADIRISALEALRHRPKAEYREVLLKGLRHPWPPIVQNAARAIANLEMKELAPKLAEMLNEPAPSAPTVVPVANGKPKFVMREMVRVNHHRNCMLCHAPVKDIKDVISSRSSPAVPVGPCPSGQEELPPSSTVVYYSMRSDATLVRADVTYLRQDFSLRMKVYNPGRWPAMQRFDFMVRTRELSEQEFTARKNLADHGEYAEAIASALSILTRGESDGKK